MINEPKDRQRAKIRILIITPYKIIQESLRILIEENRDMRVAAHTNDLEKLPEINVLNNLDVVLIYLIDGDTETVETISKLLELAPAIRVIIVTSNGDFNNQTRAVQLGAVGIVQKEQNARMLIEAIRQTYRGETWINQVLLTKLLNSRSQKKDGSKSWNLLKANSLTAREQEVVAMIGKGLKNKNIADAMFISEATVRHHLSSIYGKLGVNDRLNLVIYAYQEGLLQISDQRTDVSMSANPIS